MKRSRSRCFVRQALRAVVLLGAIAAISCSAPRTCGGDLRQGARSVSHAPVRELPASRLPAPKRLIAVGDIHGDLVSARRALRLAGVIDTADRWVGQETVLVQTGDAIDRGDQDRQVIDLFERLIHEAAAAGGTVVALNGNHELMNVSGDFRYVTEKSLAAFRDVPGLRLDSFQVRQLPALQRPRGAAFSPGGPYAIKLAQRNTVAIVGKTVFAHGGLHAEHAEYGIDRINADMRAFMLGEVSDLPEGIEGMESVIWTRRYSRGPDADECAALGQTLASIGADRLVVGHEVKPNGISSSCGGRVIYIDVGLSRLAGEKIEVLEIEDGRALRLIETGASSPPIEED